MVASPDFPVKAINPVHADEPLMTQNSFFGFNLIMSETTKRVFFIRDNYSMQFYDLHFCVTVALQIYTEFNLLKTFY